MDIQLNGAVLSLVFHEHQFLIRSHNRNLLVKLGNLKAIHKFVFIKVLSMN